MTTEILIIYDELTSFIKVNQINNYVTFTGFISREDQLSLIKNAIAVIQPSKFEGWSTVVEDAKALNKDLILSNIAVHQEQVEQNVLFFEPDNAKILAEHINYKIRNGQSIDNVNYESTIKRFAQNLLTTFSNLN